MNHQELMVKQIKEDFCLKYGHPTRSHDCIRQIEAMEPICLACKREDQLKEEVKIGL